MSAIIEALVGIGKAVVLDAVEALMEMLWQDDGEEDDE